MREVSGTICTFCSLCTDFTTSVCLRMSAVSWNVNHVVPAATNEEIVGTVLQMCVSCDRKNEKKDFSFLVRSSVLFLFFFLSVAAETRV